MHLQGGLQFIIAPLVALMILFSGSSAASAQGTLEYAGQTNWASMTQAECVQRATTALNAVNSNFGIGVPIGNFDGWLIGGTTGQYYILVSCIADDHGGSFTNQSVDRVLVHMDVNGISTGQAGNIRNFMRECFYNGTCGTGNGASTSSTSSSGGAQPPSIPPPPSRAPAGVREVDWSYDPYEFAENEGAVYTFYCPPRNGAPYTSVWGTMQYTADTPLCTAAVHAGFLNDNGGVVSLQILPMQDYQGSTRNGITSNGYRNWRGYQFVYVEQ